MISTENWKEFSLNKLFEINAGKYHSTNEYEEGNTPYISASAINNGISQRINLEADFDGNVIVAGKLDVLLFINLRNFVQQVM